MKNVALAALIAMAATTAFSAEEQNNPQGVEQNAVQSEEQTDQPEEQKAPDARNEIEGNFRTGPGRR